MHICIFIICYYVLYYYFVLSYYFVLHRCISFLCTLYNIDARVWFYVFCSLALLLSRSCFVCCLLFCNILTSCVVIVL